MALPDTCYPRDDGENARRQKVHDAHVAEFEKFYSGWLEATGAKDSLGLRNQMSSAFLAGIRRRRGTS